MPPINQSLPLRRAVTILSPTFAWSDDSCIPGGWHGTQQFHKCRLHITLRRIAGEYLQRIIIHNKHGELLASRRLAHHFTPDGFELLWRSIIQQTGLIIQRAGEHAGKGMMQLCVAVGLSLHALYSLPSTPSLVMLFG